MKTVVGITDLGEAERFAREADELYCGVPALANHRDGQRNLKDFRELGRIAALAARHGKPLLVAANEVYEPRAYRAAIAGLRKCLAAGAAGFIVRDAGLLREMKERGLKAELVLSSLALCLNVETLKFYKELGVSRVVLPQHLEVREAAGILKNRLGVKTEVFYFPQCFCPNLDGACPYHTLAPRRQQNCRITLRSGGRDYSMRKPPEERMLRLLYGYLKAGADYLKISRDDPEKKQRVLSMARAASALAAGGASFDKFFDFFKEAGLA